MAAREDLHKLLEALPESEVPRRANFRSPA